MTERQKAHKVLIISPHFYPEDFKCNEVAFELAKRGYDVTALSDIPNYPQGKFYTGYGFFRRRRECVNGVKVIRTAVIPRGKGGGVRIFLNYLSFAFTACIRAIFMAIFHKYDTIIVHQLSPITVGLPALIIKKIRPRTKLLFWVLDLWPESLEVAGGITNPTILGVFERIAKSCYRNSDKILMSSSGFRKSICAKGDFLDKLEFFPNWPDGDLYGNMDYPIPSLPSGFNVMFTGNIGEAQDFEHTLDAFRKLKEQGVNNIHLLIVGDGRKKEWVEQYISENKLTDIIHCLGRHPLSAMGAFFAKADVLYLALKDSVIFNLTCPAKLQAYMSAGKPVLAMLNGDGAEIIQEASCGMSVPAGDSEALANALLAMSKLSVEGLAKMGANGKAFCDDNFSFAKNMRNLESWMSDNNA
ncbi:MAG: glycosyltransferase family 4 protein [Rikenellaceae bacterium]|nr:glycosyltransferase family 4 protein [Rikenellaceae bacterium]